MSLLDQLLDSQEQTILQKLGLTDRVENLLVEISKNPKKLSKNCALIQKLLDKVGQNPVAWVDDATAETRFLTWIQGQTGYSLVDAAMQQVAQTGWMHNRARMVVASVLTKNLGVDWRWGQEYFRAVLIDLDEASNNGGWQWAASTGSDPKPMRIFNPYVQAENYDTKNDYQQRWLPKNYQARPIVEHSQARQQALLRYGKKSDVVRDF